MKYLRYIPFLYLFSFLPAADAQISPLDSSIDESYYYTDHYEVVINRSVSEVWPHVVEISSWMPGLDALNETKPMGVEGETFRLYGNFHMQVVKVIPEKMLLLVNLPNIQKGEETRGIAMVTAQEVDGKTLVSIFMSRIYFWSKAEKNELREKRESSGHIEKRKRMYKEGFLERLRALAEQNNQR